MSNLKTVRSDTDNFLRHEAADAVARAYARGAGARALSRVRRKGLENMEGGIILAREIVGYVADLAQFLDMPILEMKATVSELQLATHMLRRIRKLHGFLITIVRAEVKLGNPLLTAGFDQKIEAKTEQVERLTEALEAKLVDLYSCKSASVLDMIKAGRREPRSPEYETALRAAVDGRAAAKGDDVDRWADDLSASVAGLKD